MWKKIAKGVAAAALGGAVHQSIQVLTGGGTGTQIASAATIAALAYLTKSPLTPTPEADKV